MSHGDNIIITSVDSNGQSASEVYSGGISMASADIIAFKNLLQDCQLAAISTVCQEIFIVPPTVVTGTAGDFGENTQRMVLVFLDAGAAEVSFSVVGPADWCFLMDGVTVDDTNPFVADLITWMIGNLLTEAGIALASFDHGYRQTIPSGIQELNGAADAIVSGQVGSLWHAQHGLAAKVTP